MGVYPKTWCTKMEKAVKMKGNIKGKREEGDTVREELVLVVFKEFQGVKDVLKGLIEETLQEVMRVEGDQSLRWGGGGE